MGWQEHVPVRPVRATKYRRAGNPEEARSADAAGVHRVRLVDVKRERRRLRRWWRWRHRQWLVAVETAPEWCTKRVARRGSS
ncbi:hypothetical protein BAY61_22830 [Prauserella marina]|nr:hypothetical protein BAY61_22830 [Prauserella marina]